MTKELNIKMFLSVHSVLTAMIMLQCCLLLIGETGVSQKSAIDLIMAG